MPHRNAALTPVGRLKLARVVVEDGWPIRRAAERFQVSWPTAKRWAERYRQHGPAGMTDRSSRPHRSPRQTALEVVEQVKALRIERGWGPARIGPRLGLPTSTVAKILRREGMPRLCDVDLADRQRLRRQVRRYEHAAPGDLVHIDVKKLGRIPDGGGWRVRGRSARPNLHRGQGYGYLHTVLDDHSRLAYTEILPDEQGQSTADFWARAAAWFASCGVRIARCLSDNGSNYRSRIFAAALAATGTVHKRTRPYRPQTNGKVERFHRTLATEWAYARPYASETERRQALPGWLHVYNHHRHHTALGGLPPASRVTNLSGQY
ncbi:IS481 family transposase, partial [Kineococcus sp. SYSU DK002]|uniref:IS481 family transposase n=1 Tax=Kineococcus sp. SYSU DK002 TaxID=3383123 RepID=UPI003D7E449A